MKCMGGPVEWAGPAGNQKCPEFASWTLLASICRIDGGHLAVYRPGSDKKGAEFRIWRQTLSVVLFVCTYVCEFLTNRKLKYT